MIDDDDLNQLVERICRLERIVSHLMDVRLERVGHGVMPLRDMLDQSLAEELSHFDDIRIHLEKT